MDTKILKIEHLSFYIRSSKLKSKIVDLFMINSCVVSKQYNPKDFELQKDNIIIDIGGHIGSFSVLAGRTAKNGKVFSFEPDPDNYEMLVKNITLNGINNVTSSNCAVTSKKGEISFYTSKLNSAENSIYKNGGEKISINTKTLNEIINEYGIQKCDFLKIDAEGSEYEILFSSSPETLKKIDKIVMECHSPDFFGISNPEYTIKNMEAFLQKSGYKTRTVKENKMHSLIFARRK